MLVVMTGFVRRGQTEAEVHLSVNSILSGNRMVDDSESNYRPACCS